MADIFISYAKEDRSRVAPLAKALAEHGWSIWWDRTITAGKTWREVIGEALESARSVVVVWSKASVKSRWVQEEADWGLERKILIPILLDEIRPPLGFGAVQAVDLVYWDPAQSSPDFEKLIADISIILGPSPRHVREAEQAAKEEHGRKKAEEEAERARKAEAERKAEEERKRKQEEERRQAEERQILEEEQKRAEAERRAEEERKRKGIEARLKAEEEQKRKRAEAKKIRLERKAEKRRKAEEAQRLEIERRCIAEENEKRAEADRKAGEERERQKIEAKRKAEEERKLREAEEHERTLKAEAERQAEEKLKHKGIPKIYINTLGIKFILIMAGSFTMGSRMGSKELMKLLSEEKEWYEYQKPLHAVKIEKPFYLQTTPLTQGQWKRIIKYNHSCFKDLGDDHPVEQVSWEETQQFIQELNQDEKTRYYRLPSEAEWEYACRAGSDTEFFFGDDAKNLGEFAWFDDNSGSKTHPVGKKKPNAWGLYDMHGNVWEWVEDDWHGSYESAPNDGSAWIDKPRGYDRVLRGGSWANDARLCLSAARTHFRSDGCYNNLVGFRLAMSVFFDP